MQHGFIRRLAAVLFVLAISVSLPAQLGAQNEVARRVIHIEGYRPTPGDEYTLFIDWGLNVSTGDAPAQQSILLVLQQDYRIDLPYVGTIDARSLTYDQLRRTVTERVKQRLLVPFVSLTLTAPAVFDVFVWGAVGTPGYRSVTSLNRLADAVGAAGGVQSIGSRRAVEVHSGSEVRRYDLVTHLTRGDQSQNPFIRPGDRVFVPIAAAGVNVRGAVAQPGTFEVLPGEALSRIVELAGGLLPTAQLERATVTRIAEGNRYQIVSLRNEDPLALILRSGDIVTIPASTSTADTVLLEGAIHRAPAVEGTPRAIPLEPLLIEVPFTSGMSVLSVLEQFGGPTAFAQPERSFIIRSDGVREPLPDLGTVWEGRQWDRDVALRSGDRLVVPMRRLVVSVGGAVNAPGAFVFTSGYTVADYLRLAGGLKEQDGSANRIYFAEVDGSLTRVDLDTPVPVGTSIYADRSAWGRAKLAFDNVFTVTGWVTGIIGVTTVIINFVRIFSPGFP